MDVLSRRAGTSCEVHKPTERPGGRLARLSALAFSAFFLYSPPLSSAACGCNQSQGLHDTVKPASARLDSAWSGGTCSFSGNVLSYSSGKSKAVITLDAKVKDASLLLCTGTYAVILGTDKAVISIGGDRAIEGVEMLGMIGDRFVPANSYSIDISEPAAEAIVASGISATKLWLETGAGNRWTVDLSNPSQWAIY